jgi:hypothetical protein
MDFFDRHKALIITTLLFSVIILALYSFTLSSNNAKTRELLVDLDNFRVEELQKEEPEPEEMPGKLLRGLPSRPTRLLMKIQKPGMRILTGSFRKYLKRTALNRKKPPKKKIMPPRVPTECDPRPEKKPKKDLTGIVPQRGSRPKPEEWIAVRSRSTWLAGML